MKIKKAREVLTAASKKYVRSGDRETASALKKLAAALSRADKEETVEFVARVSWLRKRRPVTAKRG